MAKKQPKRWVAAYHLGTVRLREISTFDQRNPRLFELSHSAHDTFAEAHARLVSECVKELEKAVKDVQHRQKKLARVLALQAPSDSARSCS